MKVNSFLCLQTNVKTQMNMGVMSSRVACSPYMDVTADHSLSVHFANFTAYILRLALQNCENKETNY